MYKSFFVITGVLNATGLITQQAVSKAFATRELAEEYAKAQHSAQPTRIHAVFEEVCRTRVEIPPVDLFDVYRS